MRNFRFIIFAILTSCIIPFAGCSSDDDDFEPEVLPVRERVLPILIKSDNFINEYSYDNEGHVTKIKNTSRGCFPSFSIDSILYDKTGKVIAILNLQANNSFPIKYEKNTININRTSNTTITLDDKDKVNTIETVYTDAIAKSIFKYTDDNKVKEKSSSEKYISNGEIYFTETKEYPSYENTGGVFKDINAPEWFLRYLIHEYTSWAKGMDNIYDNYTSSTHKHSLSDKTFETTYKYKYNSDNFPTECISFITKDNILVDSVTIEYIKIK